MADPMARVYDAGTTSDQPVLRRVPESRAMSASKIRLRIAAWLMAGVVMGLLAAMWRWSPLAQSLDINAVAAWLKSIRSQPFAVPAVFTAYVIGSQVMFPITVLILATAYAFGPWLGFVYALLGSVLGALVTYFIGYGIGSDTYKQLTRSRFDAVANALRKKGLVAVITTHLLPVGPFTFVNLASGVVRVGAWRFVFGCVIGMLPGIAFTAFFEHQTEKMFRKPGLMTAGLTAISVLVFAGFLLWARRRARVNRG